jgi:N-acetylglucosaminyldiphosphoundecaprenol N-acetyl-beta-D-mannosaminyltransferase
VQKTKVLSVPILSSSIEECLDIINCCPENSTITATGVHGIISARTDAEFNSILNAPNTFNLPDGMPAVWVAKAKGATNIKRCFGPFVFAEIMKETASTDLKHYLCGGKEGVANALKIACEKKFGNKNIVGTHCPPFREVTDAEMQNLAKEINELQTDVVWIGISTPKQEKFASRLSKYTHVKALITVGAAFDYHTDSIRPAPKWIQNIGMEWFFRLTMEPKRLWKRYAEIVPKFILFGILDIFALYNHPSLKGASKQQ